MKKYILNPKVVRGGKAIPLGNNFYYMQGRKHEQGGIDLGADDKNGLEVEGGEVVHTSKNSIKVFSAVPMLNGKSPAEKVTNGENANKVFKEQEEFKDRNNFNDDGSKKYQNGGKRRYIGDGATKYIKQGKDLNEYSPFINIKKMGGQTKKNIFVELNVGGKKKLVPASSFTGERQKALMGTNEDINHINTPKYKGVIEKASITNPRLSPNNVLKQLTKAAGIDVALKIKKLNNINNKFSRTAGHFNEITLGDIIGGVTNTIGSITNYNSNRRALNNMKYSSAPLPIQAKKLKTRFNINPQLDKIREYLKATNRDIDANTASSRVALARKGIARTNALLQTNNLYATKENAETQLLNQDNMNQQNVAARNVEMYNRWREGKSNFDNMLLEKRAENTSDLIRGLTTTVQDTIGGIEQRKNINNTLSIIAAANSDVTAEILRDLGVNFSYLIRNGKRIKNKKN